jgi:uncharacterized protein YcbK (DUF882 family)
MAFDKNNKAGPLARRALLGTLGTAVSFAAMPAWGRLLRGERLIRLYCPETGERFEGAYWADGVYLAQSFRRIDWLMRDFHCDRVARIDPRLIDLLRRLALATHARGPVSIFSGYRTRETNIELRDEGLKAASQSEHIVARAADIRIDGVRLDHLHRAAVSLRLGGVGAYAHHIHVDTGPVRDW